MHKVRYVTLHVTRYARLTPRKKRARVFEKGRGENFLQKVFPAIIPIDLPTSNPEFGDKSVFSLVAYRLFDRFSVFKKDQRRNA